MSKKENGAGMVGFIFIAILLSKLLGLLRGSAVALFYGTDYVASAYSMASQLPVNFFDMILGSAVSSAFIPVYNKFSQTDGRDRADKFASRFINLIIGVTVVLSAIGVAFAPQIIGLMGSGMEPRAADLAAQLLRIMFPLVIFTGLAFTFVGILQSLGEFKIPAVMSLISNLVCIVYLFTLNDSFGIYGLSAALLLGWVLQFLILVYPAKKRGYTYSITSGFCDSGFKDVAKLALPVLLASWVQPINTMVNMGIASGLGGGGIAVLDYANKLYIIAASAFSMAVTNYIFPSLSRLGAENKKEEWADTLKKNIRLVLFAVLPIMLIFLAGSEEIIRVVYGRGQFGEESVRMTSSAMRFYSLGMLWFAMQEIFNKAFYSVMDSKTPVISAVGGIIINVTLSFVLSKSMGVDGLALAASVSAFACCTFSFFRLQKKTGRMKNMGLVKLIVCGVLSFAAFWFVRKLALGFIGTENFIKTALVFAVTVVAGGVVYLVSSILLKVEEAQTILKTAAGFLRPHIKR
ncbi:MAG: murein biosynthesis integral membrane protein MurJ [Clostridia bacterium]|nr:murein biosynthesis integral membrane protein MurJ [Clostridia bacterium]